MEIQTRTILRLRDALIASGTRKSAVTSSAYRVLAKQGLLSEEQKQALSRVDAIAETMFLVIAADLEVTDTEFAALKGAIRGLTGETLSDDIVEVMMETYARRLADEGRSNRLAALGQAMTDVAEARNTFTLAAAAALADGVLVDEESQVIRELKEVFGLTDSQVAEVLGELTQDGQH